jgi:hypothetical protein
VRGVAEAALGEHRRHTVDVLHAVLGDQIGTRNALRRILGMEVPGKPFDLSAILALEPRRALTRDPAEGSKKV